MSTNLPAPGAGVIAIASLAQMNRQKRKFDAVISIEDPLSQTRTRFRFRIAPYRPQLVLRFEDVDLVDFDYAYAQMAQVEDALAFGRQHTKHSMIVHCLHGVGRSAATALAIMAERAGAGSERAVVDALFAQRPEACPNQIVVALADKALKREGALQDALAAYEADNPHMAVRRENRREFAQTCIAEFAPSTWSGVRVIRNHGA